MVFWPKAENWRSFCDIFSKFSYEPLLKKLQNFHVPVKSYVGFVEARWLKSNSNTK
jgi:hypothetical protein